MNLFLSEYTSATCPNENSLHDEGWAMLSALAEDFSRIPGVRTWTLLHQSCGRDLGQVCRRADQSAEPKAFRELAARADLTLVIAPETDDVLAERCRWVAECGGRWLGSGLDAIRLTGDKLALARHWRRHRIPTPSTYPPDETPGLKFPAVCKPRHGAGSLATFLIPSPQALGPVLAEAGKECSGPLILQPYAPGVPASIVVFVGPGRWLPLAPARQELSDDGRFRYLGGTVPLTPTLASRASHLGLKAVQAVSGLHGYVGVDLVLGDAADGSEDVAVEINPRWTTSYVGLRALARANLANAFLQVVQGKQPILDWKPGPVRFGVSSGKNLTPRIPNHSRDT
jgi:predicted ATP-grasp superfamily ATP-dependent carboligase